MNEKKLLKLKQDIEDKKASFSELKGKKSATLENLKKRWNCKSLEEAEVKVHELKNSIDDLKDKRETGIQKLQKEYDL